MTTKERVRKASERFYEALNQMLNGNPASMEDIWSRGSEVTTMHPVGGREVGGNAVQASWEEIARRCSDGEVELRDQLLRVGGEIAYEIGTEHVTVTLAEEKVESEVRVTNIYRHTAGKWRMIHHHADADPDMEAVFNPHSEDREDAP